MNFFNMYCEKPDRRKENMPALNNNRSAIDRRSANRVNIDANLYKDLKDTYTFLGIKDKSDINNNQVNKVDKLSFGNHCVKLAQCILRDGSQSLRKPLSLLEKDELYRYLAHDGYQTIEIGFPMANNKEFEACKHLACLSADKSINPLETSIEVVTRAIKEDITKTWESVKEGCNPVIAIITGANEDQIKYVYRQTPAEVFGNLVDSIEFAKKLTKGTNNTTIRVAVEHFFDTKPEKMPLMLDTFEECINAGAGNIALANTVERTTPEYVAKMVKQVVERVKSLDENVVVGIHPHNDKGRGIDTAIQAVKAGAEEVDVSTYGVGERQGGNLHAENFIRVIEDDYGYKTGINRNTMYLAGERLREIMRKNEVPLKSPIETYSGIHVNGNKMVPHLYNPVDPALLQTPGKKEEKIFTSQSGGTRLWQILEDYGYKMPDNKDEARRITSGVTNYVADLENQGQTCPCYELVNVYKNFVN